jgi:bifunctional DNA-binding transcriptional regulator/antitoxin component of YhaV-PrlF toxin-antitoxin module
MATKITRCTKKGQITLPMDWREKFKTDNFMIKYDEKKLIITPVDLSNIEEEVFFDADKDNEGRGIPVENLIDMLKKIKNG